MFFVGFSAFGRKNRHFTHGEEIPSELLNAVTVKQSLGLPPFIYKASSSLTRWNLIYSASYIVEILSYCVFARRLVLNKIFIKALFPFLLLFRISLRICSPFSRFVLSEKYKNSLPRLFQILSSNNYVYFIQTIF